ncbi:MAG: alpha/beta fold hydrolase [Acidobacteriota bacterium]|nr:alpha/beta fold hydrolase [Acidobacteriota bacterium]
MKTFWAFLLFAAVASAQEIVNVDGRNVRIRVEGTGSPAVIFESGFGGDGLNSWAPIFPEIAKLTRAFAYDRAGIGKSDPATVPRTYNAIASELHAVLQHQKVAPPYILVGHSYGGALVRTFYALYPSEVSGIVFVDPITEQMFQGDAKKLVGEQEAMIGNSPAGVRAEWDFLKSETLTEFPILTKMRKPNVPMTLLVARVNRPNGWAKGVIAQYAPWIEERQDSSMIVTANSSHYIHRDQPELVVGAIRSMLYPNPLGALERTLREKGSDAAVALFRQQQLRYPKGEITPRLLNTLGYMQMREKRVDDALRFFSLNAEAFPEDANVYDSLAEAYAAKGDRDAALTNYRKSLKMDPTNSNAAAWIAKLETAKQ